MGSEAPRRRTQWQRPPGLAVGSNKNSGGWEGLLASLSVRPPANRFTPLSLSFHICKMGIIFLL